MPRKPRSYQHGYQIFHVTNRGVNKTDIFLTTSDRFRFIKVLALLQPRFAFSLYCYCLMNNHFHLLIECKNGKLSDLMKSFSISYVQYFNKCHGRVGHLFQNRFASEAITDQSYLLMASRYIHMNPVKAGLVSRPQDYRWSSYQAYYGVKEDFVNTKPVLNCFSEDLALARSSYIRFVTAPEQEDNTSPGGECSGPVLALQRPQVAAAIDQFCAEHQTNLSALRQMDVSQELRNRLIHELRSGIGLSLKEVGEIFSLSESRVSRIISRHWGKY